MPSYRRLLPLGLAIVVVSALLLVAHPARADAARPTWSVGDYWEYDILGEISPSGEAGTLRLDVVGQDSLAVGGTTYSAYRTNLTFNVTFFGTPYEIHGNAWFRTTDLSPVKLNFSFTIVIFFPITSSITITYDPPFSIQWPLTTGKTWNLASEVTVVAEVTGNPPETETALVSGTASVRADETVVVPAGPFTATPLRQTEAGGNYSESRWSDEAGNSVQEQSYNSTGTETSSMELSSYSYTPPSGTGSADTILGLPWYLWLVFVVIAVFAVAAFLMIRRKPPTPMPVPPGVPPPMQPIPPGAPMEPGPPGGPPGSPP